MHSQWKQYKSVWSPSRGCIKLMRHAESNQYAVVIAATNKRQHIKVYSRYSEAAEQFEAFLKRLTPDVF